MHGKATIGTWPSGLWSLNRQVVTRAGFTVPTYGIFFSPCTTNRLRYDSYFATYNRN